MHRMAVFMMAALMSTGCSQQNRPAAPDPHATAQPVNFVRTLPDAQESTPLLTRENAVRMRSGLVTLQPDANCGWHSTDEYEEFIVCLSGAGRIEAEAAPPQPFAAGQVAYNPPHSRHCVFNDGTAAMRYIYVVAPTTAPAEQPAHLHAPQDQQ